MKATVTVTTEDNGVLNSTIRTETADRPSTAQRLDTVAVPLAEALAAHVHSMALYVLAQGGCALLAYQPAAVDDDVPEAGVLLDACKKYVTAVQEMERGSPDRGRG
jgi:hypothetical protein